MAKRIIYIVIAVVLVVGLWYWWSARNTADNLDGGAVTSRDSAVTSKGRVDSGAVDLDGKPVGQGTADDYGQPAQPAQKTAAISPAHTRVRYNRCRHNDADARAESGSIASDARCQQHGHQQYDRLSQRTSRKRHACPERSQRNGLRW